MTPESARPVESAWADRIRDDPRVASLYRFGQRQLEMAQIHGKRVKELEAERDTLRAALAASQAREATLREALTVASDYIQPRVRYVADRGFEAHDLPIAALLEEPSPASDALGRVARASVALEALKKKRRDYNGIRDEEQRSSLSAIALMQSIELVEGQLTEAVDNLLAVAPHWGEPRGEDRCSPS